MSDFKLDIESVDDDLLKKANTSNSKWEVVVDEALVEERPVADVAADVVDQETEDAVEDDGTFSPSSLKEDPEAQEAIKDYMVNFRGMDADTEWDDMFSEFLRVQRAFVGGNSVTATTELSLLAASDEKELAIAGRAYETFDKLAGVWSDEYTGAEKAKAVGRYIWEAVRDPINLVGLGVGKGVGTITSKGGAAALRKAAVKTWTTKALEMGVSKAEVKAIDSVIKKSGTAALKKGQREIYEQAAGTALREFTLDTANKAAVGQVAKTKAKGEVVGTVGFDAAAATAIELGYQDAMVDTGVQDDIDRWSVGLSALGTVALGGVGGYLSFSQAKKATEKNFFDTFLEPGAAGPGKSMVASDIATQVSDTPDFGKVLEGAMTVEWDTKVKTGQASNIEVIADTLRTVMLGDAKKNVKGMANIMADQGIAFTPRYKGDNITNWTLDIINNLPEDDANIIVDTISSVAKKNGWKLTDPEGNVLDLDKLKIEDVTNMYAASVSKAGSALNVMSNVSRLLGDSGHKASTATDEQIQEAATSYLGWPSLYKDTKNVKPRAENIQAVQDKAIQYMVTMPGTTAANVVGSSMKAVGEVSADVVKAFMYGAGGAAQMLAGKGFNNNSMKKAIAQAQASYQIMKGAVRPGATLKEVETYGILRPEIHDNLMRYYAGGVADLQLSDLNIDANSVMGKGLTWTDDKILRPLQELTGVTIQDRFFKTQAFMYGLEKATRRQYGKGFDEMFEEHGKLVFNLPDWKLVEAAALENAMDATFSKSYAKTFEKGTGLHKIAGFIEEFRTIPGVGMTIPFGRFFNNTIDFTADYTGAKVLMRLPGVRRAFKNAKEVADTDTVDDLVDAFAKGAVGWTAIEFLTDQEKEKMEAGLGMFEEEGEGGSVVDTTFLYPYTLFKGLARLRAYVKFTDDGIPSGELAEFATVLGPDAITRTAESALKSFGEDIYKVFFGDAQGSDFTDRAVDLVTNTMGGIGQAYFSAFTRPLDPVNEIIGMIRDDGPSNYATRGSNMAKAFRYLDNWSGFKDVVERATAGEDGRVVERRSATNDSAVRTGITASAFGYRTVNRKSATQKVMDHIGRQQWQLDEYDGPEELNQKMNELIFIEVEPMAEKLLKSDKFLNAPLAQREEMATEMFSKAKQSAKKQLSRQSQNLPEWYRPHYEFISKGFSEVEIREGLKELGLPQDTELTSLKRRDFQRLEMMIKRRNSGRTGATRWKDDE